MSYIISQQSYRPYRNQYLVRGQQDSINQPTTVSDTIRSLLKKYDQLNQNFSDVTEKQLLGILTQLQQIIEAHGIPADVDKELADALRDEYGSKHFAVDTLVKTILDKTHYGQRLQQSVEDIDTGEFLDQRFDTNFLSPQEYTQYAGTDGLLSYAEAVTAKRDLEIFQYILPASVQKQSGKEYIYVRPGDLLFTGAARKRDDINVFPNAYFWGGLFGILGMQKMHVGAYIGHGQIIESGKDEEGKNQKPLGWNGVTTENIYDSIFSTSILNGLTTIKTTPDTRAILVKQLINEEGIDYDFLHSIKNKDVDCAELIVKAYSNQGIFPKNIEAKPDAIFKATINLLK
jgi:hypothetical protein